MSDETETLIRDVKVTYAIGVVCASALCFLLGWIARGAV